MRDDARCSVRGRTDIILLHAPLTHRRLSTFGEPVGARTMTGCGFARNYYGSGTGQLEVPVDGVMPVNLIARAVNRGGVDGWLMGGPLSSAPGTELDSARGAMGRMMGRRVQRRAAFGAVELMLALVLLALAIVPLLGTIVDTGREAGFSGAHLLANVRVAAMLDAAEAQGWIAIPQGQAVVTIAVPPAAGDPPDALWGPAPEQYGEVLYAERLEDGLVRLGAKIRWATKGPKGFRTSEAGSMRVLRRTDASFTKYVRLDRTGESLGVAE